MAVVIDTLSIILIAVVIVVVAWAVTMTVLYATQKKKHQGSKDIDFAPLIEKSKPKKIKSNASTSNLVPPQSTLMQLSNVSASTATTAPSMATPSTGVVSAPVPPPAKSGPTYTTERGPNGETVQVVMHPVETVSSVPPGAVPVNSFSTTTAARP